MIKNKAENFFNWLSIDLKKMSWENEFKNDFLIFWNYLFNDDVQLNTHFSTMDKFILISDSGPLNTWLRWLKDSYVFYLYTHLDLSVNELSKISGMKITNISYAIRKNLTSYYSIYSKEVDDFLSIVSPQEEASNIKFKDFVEKLNLDLVKNDSADLSLRGLEVTLLKNWDLLIEELPKEKVSPPKKKHYISIPKQITFLQELFLLFILGSFLIFTIKYANQFYENYLSKQVSLFEMNFNWLNKDKVFEDRKTKDATIDLSYKEIEKIEKDEIDFKIEDRNNLNRYEDESDVVVTSVKSIPQNFEQANREQSSYEEKRKGGYRDFSYGRRKAYRVMLTSVKPNELKTKLNEILRLYDVSKVDNVDPGKKIPGGLYFNLYVPRKQIKNFLSEMDEISGATILESKTIFGGPRNMDKVFIWIKEV